MTRSRIPRYVFVALAIAGLGLLLTMTMPRGTAAEAIDGLTREQLAGLYPSLAGAPFQPPACVAGQEMFDDVSASDPFCPWIEELARRGVTSGCTANLYCPNSPVTRSQMAVFVVKATEACPTLNPTDEMIRVGGVCIDKYEASIWDAPVGGNLITGPIPCSANGQDCDNIFARSVAGVQPRGSITWFQAQAALANVGKRLPTNAEWQLAVLGTPDPGASPGPEDCNTSSPGPEATGERLDCVSRWGVHDMVGNLWEWVADWDEQSSPFCALWPAEFGSDLTCIGRGSGEASTRFPGALLRSGDFGNDTGAGPFVGIAVVPSFSDPDTGFRGAR